MLVYFGPYKDYISPWHVAEKLCFWAPKIKNDSGIEDFPEWVDKFGDFLSKTWVLEVCQWIEKHNKRTEYVKIHSYDTWSMDTTLAPIILPMLKQLQATKHGAPHVDDEDVPEIWRSTNAPEKEHDYDVDEFHFQRWDYVLGEMIWAFEQYTSEWENQFYTGTIDISTEEDEESGHLKMVHGPNHTSVFDSEGYMNHLDRIKNGFRLFGLYFTALWD